MGNNQKNDKSLNTEEEVKDKNSTGENSEETGNSKTVTTENIDDETTQDSESEISEKSCSGNSETETEIGTGGNPDDDLKGEKKKDPKDEKIEDLTDRLKRNLAEFDNFRKRTQKEKSEMFDMGARTVLEKLLPTLDNFERGLETPPCGEQEQAFVSGMQMIYKQLLKEFEDVGVLPMDCKGKPFDPNFHNAVMHIEDDSLGENVVAEELQKGYMYKDTVLRHSMVKVAN